MNSLPGRANLFDLTTSRALHIVGAGGSGMGPIATVLHAMGHRVTGSDALESPGVERLRQLGVEVHTGLGEYTPPADTEALAVSTAIPESNAQVQHARNAGIPVLRRAEVLAAIAVTRRTVAVAGTHGKTTTSTFMALVLESGGLRPSWIIGGDLVGRGTGAQWDSGPWFVVEADESDGTFIELGAEAVVVTNVEPDHLEHYGGWEGLVAAFDQFVAAADGPRVVCIDDPGAAGLAARFPVTTYGTDPRAQYRIVDLNLGRYETAFGVEHGNEKVAVVLPAPGLHNVRNATAAIAMGNQLDVPMSVAAAGLNMYAGIGRRFQRRGERAGVTFVDDYAHLPSEVKAAVSAALDGGWDRVVAVFQPHRFSRTQQVGPDFGQSFDGVDLVILTDIYAAGEPPRPGVTGQIVCDAVSASPGHPEMVYMPDRRQLPGAVAAILRPGDLCLTLGAGDITKLADEILTLL